METETIVEEVTELVQSYAAAGGDPILPPTYSYTFDGVLDMLLQSIRAAYGIFYDIFDSLGAWGFFLTMFVIFTVTRLLLIPFIGGRIGHAGSDEVKVARNIQRAQQNNNDGGREE